MAKIIIPKEAIAYDENTVPSPFIDTSEGMEYEPKEGEKINVRLWVRYPSYDFIFGVPYTDSPKFKEEVSFFQYRDTRFGGGGLGAYLDIEETKEFIEGLSKCLEFSKTHSKHLWKNLKEK